MRTNKLSMSTVGLFALILVGALAWAGCGNEDTLTGSDGLALDQLVEDPLDGVLDAAQGETPAEPGERLDRLAEELELTDDQKTALGAAYLAFRTSHDVLRDRVRSGELTRREAKAQALVLRVAFEAELQVILTPEQYDRLQELRAARRGHLRRDRRILERWNDWLTEIGADEAQVTAVHDAMKTLHDGLHDIHRRVRAEEITREEARDELIALREAFDEALQTILTPEQYEALQDLRPDCPGPDDR